MNIDPETITFDQKVRHYVYDQTMKTTISPTVAETAAALSTTTVEVQASFQRLADAHMLVLQRDTAEILMANPFSAVPTPFLAQVDGKTYYGNCIWDDGNSCHAQARRGYPNLVRRLRNFDDIANRQRVA